MKLVKYVLAAAILGGTAMADLPPNGNYIVKDANGNNIGTATAAWPAFEYTGSGGRQDARYEYNTEPETACYGNDDPYDVCFGAREDGGFDWAKWDGRGNLVDSGTIHPQ